MLVWDLLWENKVSIYIYVFYLRTMICSLKSIHPWPKPLRADCSNTTPAGRKIAFPHFIKIFLNWVFWSRNRADCPHIFPHLMTVCCSQCICSDVFNYFCPSFCFSVALGARKDCTVPIATDLKKILVSDVY